MTKARPMAFTLIELLVVIGIILAIAALLMPALNVVKERARKHRAEREINQIVQSWTAFLQDYRHLPHTFETMGPDAMKALKGEDTVRNPNRYKYMDFRGGTRYFIDPWGTTGEVSRVYRIRLANRDKVPPDDFVRVPGWDPIYKDVVAWSCGRNGRDESGRGDDVRSWE